MQDINKKRKIYQICVVTRDLENTMKKWVEYLGIGPWKIVEFTEKTVKNFQVGGQTVTEPFKFVLAFAQVGDIEFEIAQPVYGPSIYEEFLKTHGEGLHHFKEKISDGDMENMLASYKKKGIGVMQSGRFIASTHYYLKTEPVLDIIVELGNCPVQNVPPELVRIYPEE